MIGTAWAGVYSSGNSNRIPHPATGAPFHLGCHEPSVPWPLPAWLWYRQTHSCPMHAVPALWLPSPCLHELFYLLSQFNFPFSEEALIKTIRLFIEGLIPNNKVSGVFIPCLTIGQRSHKLCASCLLHRKKSISEHFTKALFCEQQQQKKK